MRIAIVDDEALVRDILKEYIKKLEEETGYQFEVDIFVSGDELLEKYRLIYDIIIFDIDMPGTNGMDTARMIRGRDQRVTILFITNIAQYAINGYEVDAIDYIIKPVSYYDFSMKFQRAVRKNAQKRDHIIQLNAVDGVVGLHIADIEYVEVLSHYLIYHTGKHDYKARGSMKELETVLGAYNFCRVHKCYLVNLNCVDEIGLKEVVLEHCSVPLGRVYKEKLMRDYMAYIRG